jgi:CRISPR-associated protein Cas1
LDVVSGFFHLTAVGIREATMDNLLQLTRFQDRLSYLYLERGHIEQEATSIAYVTENGRIPIPAADLALLMLGPGTTITHRAICNLADCNCTVVWVGEEGVRFYCAGRGGTHFSANLLHQAALSCDLRARRAVVVRMYEKRFAEKLESGLHIQVIRGKEGYRVRSAYERLSREYGVVWEGRNYDPDSWGEADPLNRAISAGSACLNGLVQAAIVSAGYSTALGFVHTGKMLSFVYDIADLYKVDLIVPLAFRVVAESDESVESRVRQACRDIFRGNGLMSRIVPDIREVLGGDIDRGAGVGDVTGGSESMDDRTAGRDIPWQHDREDS